MFGKSLNLDGTKKQTIFKDIQANDPASGYIQSAVDRGIISGYPDGSFKPTDIITRGQMAPLITRAFQLTNTSTIKFKDVYPDMTSYDAVSKIVGAKITSVFLDNTFRPNLTIIRGQAADE